MTATLVCPGYYEMHELLHASIDRALASGSLDAGERAKLELVPKVRAFAQDRIGHADDLGLFDFRVFVQHVFDFRGRDVFAADTEDVLDATLHVDPRAFRHRGCATISSTKDRKSVV